MLGRRGGVRHRESVLEGEGFVPSFSHPLLRFLFNLLFSVSYPLSDAVLSVPPVAILYLSFALSVPPVLLSPTLSFLLAI